MLAHLRLGDNIQIWQKWADEGHIPSTFLVALALLKGNGIAKDNDKAPWWQHVLVALPRTGFRETLQRVTETVAKPREI